MEKGWKRPRYFDECPECGSKIEQDKNTRAKRPDYSNCTNCNWKYKHLPTG